MPRKSSKAFTLAELLIALAILGVIATFAIPKVLQAQQDATYKSIAKETAGIISSAYNAYRLNGMLTSNTSPVDLIPYINYVNYDTGSTIDAEQGNGARPCTSASPCLKLHNGAMLVMRGTNFAGTGANNAITFFLDPDGVDSGTTDGPGKSVCFYLYFSGKLRTWGTIEPNTLDSSPGSPFNPTPSKDPPWFSWN